MICWTCCRSLSSIFFFYEIFQGKHCKSCCVAVMSSIIQWMKDRLLFYFCWTNGDIDGIMAILYSRYFLGELLAPWNSNNIIPVDGGCIGEVISNFRVCLLKLFCWRYKLCVKSCYFVIVILSHKFWTVLFRYFSAVSSNLWIFAARNVQKHNYEYL